MKETKYKNYFVTELGEVYSLYKVGGQGSLLDTPRRLSPKTDKDGYQEVCLCVNGRHFHRRVHRLVYETFVKEIPKHLTIDHIDSNPANNSLSNLQILTRADNTRKSSCQPITICLDSEKYNFNSNKQAIQFLGVSEATYYSFKKGRTPYIKKYKGRKLEILEG